jgi:hypothetical protein
LNEIAALTTHEIAAWGENLPPNIILQAPEPSGDKSRRLANVITHNNVCDAGMFFIISK